MRGNDAIRLESSTSEFLSYPVAVSLIGTATFIGQKYGCTVASSFSVRCADLEAQRIEISMQEIG